MVDYTDHVIKIGSSHKICEDYAISGNQPFSYFAISDGCSSSENTDIGSRIILMSIKKILKIIDIKNNPDWCDFNNPKNNIYKHELLKNIAKFTMMFEIEEETLDATFLFGYYNSDTNKIYIFGMGDGNIIYKKNNSIIHENYNFNSEYPMYLSYLINKNRYQKIQSIYNKEDLIVVKSDINNVIDKKYENPINFIYKEFNTENIDWLILSSDGLESFLKDNEKVNIIKDLTSFKQLRGEFVTRRFNKFIKNSIKNNIDHYDDISISGISFEKGDS